MSENEFVISDIEPNDVAALVQVHTAAFKRDQFSNLMILNRPADAHQTLMQKSINFWMSNPTAKLMKAVDATGEILGWACWVMKEVEAEGPKPADTSNPKTEPIQKTEQCKVPPQDLPRALGGLMHKESVQWEERYVRAVYSKYMVLQALATDPRYQRRGIASALINKGIEEIDSENLPCWIHASPSSYTVYKRAGFEEVGRSDYDLDEWAPHQKERDWGTYTFRYMLRPAGKHVTNTSE